MIKLSLVRSCGAVCSIATLLIAGCSTSSGGAREISLRPSRLVVLEANSTEMNQISNAELVIRNCPATVDVDSIVRNSFGAATDLQLTASAGKKADAASRSPNTLIVECTTATDREGGELGASRPAAIGLIASLASRNEVVWAVRYFYRDTELSSDVLALASRVEVGGGARFASLSELASSGVREIAESYHEARAGSLLR